MKDTLPNTEKVKDLCICVAFTEELTFNFVYMCILTDL